MTNKEKYQKTFSVLQLPESSSWEVEKMARLQKKAKMKTAAAIITGCLLVGGAGTAYAANVGGIQRTIQLWIHGDQTTATLEFSGDGTYTMEILDGDGNSTSQDGGGFAIDADGTKRPLTPDELMEELDSPDVEYLDDGTVWVYYHNQKINITDKFDKDKICYVKIADGSNVLYLTVKYQNGYSYSSDKYPEPSEFN